MFESVLCRDLPVVWSCKHSLNIRGPIDQSWDCFSPRAVAGPAADKRKLFWVTLLALPWRLGAAGRAAYGGSQLAPETAARLRTMDSSTSEEEEEEEDVPLGLRRKQLQRHQQTKAQGHQRDRPAQQGQMQAPVRRLEAPAGRAPQPTAGSQAAAAQAAGAARPPRGSSQQHTVTGNAGQNASHRAAPAGAASKPPLGARASNKPVRVLAACQMQGVWATCGNGMPQ